jgi:hypothetical protein
MKKAISVLKMTLKFIMWVIIGNVLLLVIIAGIIQIPVVQLKVANYVTSYISSKTHTKVEIKKIHIAFPTSIVIKGLYLEDLKKDTLLYIGCVSADIAFNDLFDKKIHILVFALQDMNLKVYRTGKDSLYNYDFLLKAFSDTTNRKKAPSKWVFSIDNAGMKNIRLSYVDEYKEKNFLATPEGVFDASHFVLKDLTLKAKDVFYSSDKTEARIGNFTAVDQNGFAIKTLKLDFNMDEHSLSLKNFLIKTTHSSIETDLYLKYSSFKSLLDSIPFMNVYANLKNMNINNSDILYFSPQLSNQNFFKNRQAVTTVSGVISGSLNDLKGENIAIHTGFNTSLKADFNIVGLPDFKTASFIFPSLKINSGKKDIKMFTGPLLSNKIEIPEEISMQITFRGMLKSFMTTVGIKSSFGSAHIYAKTDKNERFNAKVSFTDFDLGRLLKNKDMFGSVSLNAEANGNGLDMNSIQARIKAEVSQIYLNKYTYHDLKLDGDVSGRAFKGKINLNDRNAAFVFDGLVNLNPKQESCKFLLDLKGANLQKLNLSDKDTRIGLLVVADFKGATISTLNGKAGITNIEIMHEGKSYRLDSLMLSSKNDSGKIELNINSPIIGLKYTGNISPVNLPAELTAFIGNYFSVKSPKKQTKSTKPQNFNIEIQLHNNPILSEVLLPQLKEFDPGIIKGSYDNQKSELKLNAIMNKIVYGTTEIKDLVIDASSDANALNYKISTSSVSNSKTKFDNLLLEGKLADQLLLANILSIDQNKNKKLLIQSRIVMDGSNFRISLDPKELYLMNERWDIAAGNYIEIGKKGFLIHNFSVSKSGSQINIASVNDRFNDDLNIGIKNFRLDDISGIIEKDTGFIKGNVDGNVLLKRTGSTYGIIADAQISNIFVSNEPIGNLFLKASNHTAGKFDVEVNLSGSDNNLNANGSFIPNGGDHAISLKADIQSLSLKTVKAFSFGQISEASGGLTGSFFIQGSTTAPEITGELVFNNAFIKPALLNNQLELKHETIQLNKDGILFNSFTMLDKNKHTAIIDGSVKMTNFRDFIFALTVKTTDFMLINTTAKDNKQFFGTMVLDSRIDIKGPITLPLVNARLKLKKGSNFTFAVPEEKLTSDKGEDVVEFEDTLKRNSILYGEVKNPNQKSGLTGFDISSIIEIDKQATLKLLMDPSSSDSLVVRGEAALSFGIDRSGKMSLTGAYNLNEGSYLVSLESIVKRKFTIEPGSTIIWNGDPLGADISINAIYSVRASPLDLVADQMSGLSETDKNAYKLRYPFLVYLKLRGEILKPEISFEIQLPPEDKGILGGAVNAKLSLLNEDPSSLNKQVFALLVLGRFIQENPLQTESSGISTTARATVSKFLSEQLNQMSSKIVPGVELNFDVQSYEDYQSGQAAGRTQVNVGIKKQLFNERLSVQLGGMVDVEGEKAKQNSASDITSDVTLEYKITKDGRFRLKGYRQNQYEGIIEGQLVETGAGVVYVRDFNKWKNLLSKTTNNHETSNHK